MIEPPGSSKTMLAKRLPSILPDLRIEEAIETTMIHSVMGLLPKDRGLIATRPFRSPHHAVSEREHCRGTIPSDYLNLSKLSVYSFFRLNIRLKTA